MMLFLYIFLGDPEETQKNATRSFSPGLHGLESFWTWLTRSLRFFLGLWGHLKKRLNPKSTVMWNVVVMMMMMMMMLMMVVVMMMLMVMVMVVMRSRRRIQI